MVSDRALRVELEQMAKMGGARLFGVADLRPVKDYIEEIYGPDLLHYERGVVMAIPYPVTVVNQLNEGPTHTYLYYYNVLNTSLDNLALKIAIFLQDKGFNAFPVPASQRITADKLGGIFSHRLVANLAGIGWIGKNSNLITEEYGPRIRLVTVLTDAPLPTDEPIQERCGTCRACADACPPSAITGKAFAKEDSLDARLNAKACDEYMAKVRVSFGKRICGRCLAACPWGKKTNKRRA
jgi:epoxyqueuosine reductase